MKFSIVIPVLNREDLLKRLLNNLLSSSTQHVKEVIIIDNSFDPKVSRCCDHVNSSLNVELIVRKNFVNNNLGFSGSFNWALDNRNSLSNPFIFLNNDIVMTADDVSDINTKIENLETKACPPCIARLFGWSALIAWPQNFIDTIGRLDENFYPAYYEDVDAELRLRITELSRKIPPNTLSLSLASAFPSLRHGEDEYLLTYKESHGVARRPGGCHSRHQIFETKKYTKDNHDYLKSKWGLLRDYHTQYYMAQVTSNYLHDKRNVSERDDRIRQWDTESASRKKSEVLERMREAASCAKR